MAPFAALKEREPAHPPPETLAVAKGIRILFNFSRCEGPLTEALGLPQAIKQACKKAGVTVLGQVRFKRFPDGTMNATADLSESHFGLGTYLAAKHVAGEVNMCHERCDNTALARRLVACFAEVFKPQHKKLVELSWQSE